MSMRKLRRRYRNTFVVKGLSLFIAWVIAPLAMIEIGLHIADPQGAGQLAANVSELWYYNRPEPRGHSLPPGTHYFTGWTATINDDRTRYTPAQNTAAPTTITIVGDSVAFGWGANDADTFANVLSEQCPNVNFENAAVTSFNIDRLAKTFETFDDSDAYLWLAIHNDPEHDVITQSPQYQHISYIEGYLRRFVFKPEVEVITDERWAYYINRVKSIIADERVTLLAFDDGFGVRLKTEIDATVILPPYYNFVSRSDFHPNRAGHREIAAGILPLLSDYGCSAME